jgi:hypothetical protein
MGGGVLALFLSRFIVGALVFLAYSSCFLLSSSSSLPLLFRAGRAGSMLLLLDPLPSRTASFMFFSPVYRQSLLLW